jgi:hypothetical protein
MSALPPKADWPNVDDFLVSLSTDKVFVFTLSVGRLTPFVQITEDDDRF